MNYAMNCVLMDLMRDAMNYLAQHFELNADVWDVDVLNVGVWDVFVLMLNWTDQNFYCRYYC